jgi:hypothetical protein
MQFLSALLSVLILICAHAVSPAVAADVAVLMPGSAGIVPGDFLVRNEGNFKRAGLRTVLTTSPSIAAQTVAAEAAQKRKSVIVGMSRGAADAAAAIAAGARPAGVVFVSGVYARAMSALGTPDKLPPTLIVHHSRDILQIHIAGCRFRIRRLDAWQSTYPVDQYHRRAVIQPLQCARGPRLLSAGQTRGRRDHRLHQVSIGDTARSVAWCDKLLGAISCLARSNAPNHY